MPSSTHWNWWREWREARRSGSALLRVFSAASWWNTPLDSGGNAPAAADTATLVAGLQTFSTLQYVVLTGTPLKSPEEAQPIYLPVLTDTLYHIVPSGTGPTVDVRIPAGAKGNGGANPKMSVLDTTTNQFVGLVNAIYTAGTDSWATTGVDRYWLDGNGVADGASPAGTAGNNGHRGAPFAMKSPRIAEVDAGVIAHRLECFVNPSAIHGENNGGTFVWPMIGQDNPTSNGPVEEGMVFRIKRTVNLAGLGLSPAALVIAKALQDYGVMITDGGGVNTTIRLEWADPFGDPTWIQAAWTARAVVDDSLSAIPFNTTNWEFVQAGYRMPGSTP